MKKLLVLLTGLFASIVTFAQYDAPCETCLPDGIEFTTQAQIDNFSTNFPNCTEIIGGVWISGNNITNLSGLSVINTFGSDLRIFDNNSLVDLSGLQNVISIGSNFYIGGNDSLSTLNGLEGLITVNGDLSIGHNGDLGCDGNYSLTNIEGLENLNHVAGNLEIIDNYNLINLSGLENLNSIEGNLQIGSVYYHNGMGMMKCCPNGRLSSLSGLNNVNSVGGDILIYCNDSLTDITALNSLTSIGGIISIGYYFEYQSLTYGNPMLQSLSGLDNIEAESIEGIYMIRNFSLSDCAIQSICDYLAMPFADVIIDSNALGCNSQEVIEEICESVSIEEPTANQNITFYPTPATTTITIQTNNKHIAEIKIYNLTGQVVLQERPSGNTIDVSGLKDGLYILECLVGDVSFRQKVVVRE